MMTNFIKLYLIRMLFILLITLPLLFVMFVSIPNLDSKYALIPIIFGIFIAPKIKKVHLQSSTEMHLVWFGSILKKLPF